MPIQKAYLAVALVVFLCAMVHAASQSAKAKQQDPQAVHESAIVVDTHADTPQRFLDENFDLADDAGAGHMDFAKIRKGNLGAEFFSIWVDPKLPKTDYAKRAFDLIDSVYLQAKKHPDEMVMAYTADDIVHARTGNHKKLAALMGVEGGHAMENDLHILRDFYRLGVRYMTLTHTNTNEWADSSGDMNDATFQHHNGLTDFGKDVVREMNRLGMMVDISHVSDKTFWDVIEVSKAPVIASHSSARALTNAPRNITDDMLRAITKNGGVVMVNFYAGFVDDTYRKNYEAQTKDREAASATLQDIDKDADPVTKARDFGRLYREWGEKAGRPPFTALIDHIDHIAKVAGIDHVGLGSDFDGIPALPQGIDSAADLPKITAALMERGYSADDVRKILGGNILRVFRDVERVSREMQQTGKAATP